MSGARNVRCGLVVALIVFMILIGVLTHALKRHRYKLYSPEGKVQKQDYRFLINRPMEFIRPPEAAHLDCGQMLKNEEIANEYAQQRIVYKDPPWPDDLPTNCQSIFQRNYFQLDSIYREEERFPLAFVRVVYKDYRQLEMELAATYAPQNTYCYAIDSKATKTFHARVNALAACLPNVFVTRVQYKMNSWGHNVSFSSMECVKMIRTMDWKYVVLLQNHDVALKTNQELIRILQWYNGTNDVSAQVAPMRRIRQGFNWSFKYLELFKNKTRNTRMHNYQPPILQFAKSLAQVALSRQAVDFMLDQMNLNRLLAAFEWNTHGVDEQLMGTLNSNDAIDLPGGFTLHCLRKGIEIGSKMRLSFWFNDTSCRSGMKRHRICIFGVEDLGPNLFDSSYFFANKFMQERDFGALVCWHELMFNRTHLERGHYRLNKQEYLDLPQVRFNHERSTAPNFRASNFPCH